MSITRRRAILRALGVLGMTSAGAWPAGAQQQGASTQSLGEYCRERYVKRLSGSRWTADVRFDRIVFRNTDDPLRVALTLVEDDGEAPSIGRLKVQKEGPSNQRFFDEFAVASENPAFTIATKPTGGGDQTVFASDLVQYADMLISLYSADIASMLSQETPLLLRAKTYGPGGKVGKNEVFEIRTTGASRLLQDALDTQKSINAALKNEPECKKELSKRSPCFVTTICCQGLGLPDDCWELGQLRKLRNGWLIAQPHGAEAIAEYHRSAPALCAAIEASPRRGRILRRLYWSLILPCATLESLGLHARAYRRYRRVVERLGAAAR